ncbi:MAG TPA: NADH-quinone oxidoreductase subunit L [Bryobacteraceae bacterium]|jgi:NADH-quinone oxidoreductase subunit L|nr:NADH-quinone oxidoreductase subunit L [Bryobacteraceae bacterium]
METQHLWLIPILPLIGAGINGIFGKKLPKSVINAVAIGSVVLSFLWVLKVLAALGLFGGHMAEGAHVERYFSWLASGNLNIGFDFSVDPLTAVMLLVVTGIGSLIHIYATGYMAHEGGYWRFFSYLNLFMFFMLVLVLAANYLVLFIGWEGVGLCSYLLIGFYYTEKFATDAGKKAFIVNRIGDFGLSLAMYLIVRQFGSLDFGKVFEQARALPPDTGAGIFTAICLLLMVGAAGKSAQIPLHVWLPDAMAGPTPVSALIHAATMVTAGVYLCARSNILFTHSDIALTTVAVIGIMTAFFAATIGLVQNDIKKVYAYSTVSQLGYMFLGVGVGAFAFGIWHVVTHAFFKALLFLGAGSVIHACGGEQDMQLMGGLRKKTPITFYTLFAAALAIAGVPFTSGWFSKDAILLAAHERSPILFWIGTFTAGLTAFYVFRSIFLTFFGEYRGTGHPHESPPSMTMPLIVLAILSLVGGFLPVPHWLEPVFPPVHEGEHGTLGLIVSAAGLIGIALAYVMYVVAPRIPESIARTFSGVYRLLYNKYYVDEIYDAIFVEPIVQGSRVVLWKGFDAGLIDGIVNGIGARSWNIGAILRQMQSGNIRSYAGWVVLGSVLVILAMTITGGLQ